MALEAFVNRDGVSRIVLEERKEGVYVYLFALDDPKDNTHDYLQDDWESAKRFANEYGARDDQWREIPDTDYHAPPQI